MDECVFCEIVAGHLPASIIVEDDLVLAFVDIHQTRGGKALVIAK